RVMENLVYAGAFDSFGLSRGVFFAPTEKHETFIENLLKYGSAHQEDKVLSVNSLFGDGHHVKHEAKNDNEVDAQAEDADFVMLCCTASLA
ncbi:MAG: hypothetical protein ABL962_04035, partial [Fimbriimonadaceae bacterium]